MKTLKRLRPRKTILDDFYVFDTETGISKDKVIEWQLNGRPESFIFGCIVGKNYRKEIHSVEEFKQEFKDPRYKKRKVFAHNAEYDLNVLYGCIFHLDPEAIFNGKFICATNGNCIFADSLNIYRTSVKSIGKMLGLDKIGMSGGNYKKSNWKNKEERARDINACFRDCEIIYEALFRIFEEAGDIKITQASLSMTYFRRFHLPFDINHNDNTAFFFDSYFGGRTECFKMGKTNATVIDVNSMYPAVMKSIRFPNPSALKVANHVNVNSFLKFILPHYEGLIYADLYHKKHKFGFLPEKRNGKLLFPVGNLSGCWNFNEIRLALEHGVIEIKNISRAVYGPGMDSIFTGYVNELYRRRSMSKDDLERYSLKLFMNSLYGKFSQRITEETVYIEDIQKQKEIILDYRRKGLLIKIQPFNADRNDCFLILKSTKKIDISFSIPSFASYITSAARVVLLKKLIELQDKKVVYCDTDSIFFEINNNVETSTALGGWKIENKIVTEIRGLKNYKYIDTEKGEVHRIKGVPVSATKTGENSYTYENLIKTKEGMRRGLTPGILIKRSKIITGIYDKRVILSNGETEPIIL